MAYEYFEHIADIGIQGTGNTLEKAFEEAAKAMFEIMIDLSKVNPKNKISFSISADNNEEMFVEFLNELLSLSSLKNLMFSKFKVKIEKNKLNATAFGEKISEKMKLKTEVKAATYSQLKVKKQGNEFVAKTIVDV